MNEQAQSPLKSAVDAEKAKRQAKASAQPTQQPAAAKPARQAKPAAQETQKPAAQPKASVKKQAAPAVTQEAAPTRDPMGKPGSVLRLLADQFKGGATYAQAVKVAKKKFPLDAALNSADPKVVEERVKRCRRDLVRNGVKLPVIKFPKVKVPAAA